MRDNGRTSFAVAPMLRRTICTCLRTMTTAAQAAPTASTSRACILPCDPKAISFPLGAESPEISTPTARTSLEQAAKALQQNQLVAFPTETVYGLGGSALAGSTAIPKIYRTKGRPSDNPLIVHIAHPAQLPSLVDPQCRDHLPKSYKVLAEAFWPGALTLLVPTIPGELVSENVTCGLSTVGVRVPSHPVARALISLAGVPVAAPSANTSGRPSPTLAKHVQDDLKGKSDLACILDGGPCSVGLESTVVSAFKQESPRSKDKGKGREPHHGGEAPFVCDVDPDGREVLHVLRLGGVSPEDIRRALLEAGLQDSTTVQIDVHPGGTPNSASSSAANGSTATTTHSLHGDFIPSTPGMKYKHYSPDAKVVLLRRQSASRSDDFTVSGPALSQYVRQYSHLPVGILHLEGTQFAEALESTLPITKRFCLGDPNDHEAHARRLFAGLRQLDDEGVKVILVECVTEEGLGRTVMERLRKSAGGMEPINVRS